MTLVSYEGETFVAFLDISGFKDLMRNEDRAWRALDKFYNIGYLVLGNNRNDENVVDGLFVSDCGILYLKQENLEIRNRIIGLRKLLRIVKDINVRMRDEGFMLTTSIAYGRFKYQKRIEFPGIGKNPVYGNAYVAAFMDNEYGRPRLQPGLCRIINRNLPEEIKNSIVADDSDEIFRMVKARRGDNRHLYYYWMVESPIEVDNFEQRYKDSDRYLYEGRLRALRGE